MIKVLITADLLRNAVVNDVHTLAKSTHMQTDCTRALANVPENKMKLNAEQEGATRESLSKSRVASECSFPAANNSCVLLVAQL